MSHFQPLTDSQWMQLEQLFPKLIKRSRGKPHTAWRSVVNSIFLILYMKIKWGAIPSTPDFATKSAAHRWFVRWEKNGFLTQLVNQFESLSQIKPEIFSPSRRQRKPKPLNLSE